MTTPTVAGGDLSKPTPFNRPLLSQQEIFTAATRLGAQIDWTFDEEAKAYKGAAPYGRFVLFRHPNGTLAATFENIAEIETPGENDSFNAEIGLSDCDTVATAKASVTHKLVEALNQSRRDDPLLDTVNAVNAEPDLI